MEGSDKAALNEFACWNGRRRGPSPAQVAEFRSIGGKRTLVAKKFAP